jgi:hypothetical protein
MKPTEILHRLSAQYVRETLSPASAYDWYVFSQGRKEALNLLYPSDI